MIKNYIRNFVGFLGEHFILREIGHLTCSETFRCCKSPIYTLGHLHTIGNWELFWECRQVQAWKCSPYSDSVNHVVHLLVLHWKPNAKLPDVNEEKEQFTLCYHSSHETQKNACTPGCAVIETYRTTCSKASTAVSISVS